MQVPRQFSARRRESARNLFEVTDRQIARNSEGNREPDRHRPHRRDIREVRGRKFPPDGPLSAH